jgi:hypothetical protein
VITHLAIPPNRDGIGSNATLGYPFQSVMDSKGFIYLVDYIAVRKISPQYGVTTVARIAGRIKGKMSLSSIQFKKKVQDFVEL